MLVGQVREDRGVVRDAQDAVQRERVRGRLEHRRGVPVGRPSRASVAWSSGAPGVVTWASWRSRVSPILRLDRADQPASRSRPPRARRAPGTRSSSCRPCPVTPMTPMRCDGSPYHQRRRVRRAPAGTRRRRAAARAPPARRARRWPPPRRRPPPPRRSRAPSTWNPGTATNSVPSRTARESSATPRTAMSARPPRRSAGRPAARRGRGPRRPSRVDQAAAADAVRRARQRRASSAIGALVGHRAVRAAPTARSSARHRPPERVAPRARDTLLRPGERHPRRPERLLVLVQAERRLALARHAARAGHVHAAEVHLGPALGERELDRAPAQEVHARPGGRGGARRGRREWTVERRRPWRYRTRPPSDVAVRRALARLEVDEVTGGERPGPPAHELLGARERRTRGGPPSRAAGRRSGRGPRSARSVARTWPSSSVGARVPAHDDDAVALGAPDPLPGRLRDAVHERGLVRAGGQRDRHPVARRLDLGDAVEARPRRARAGTHRRRPRPPDRPRATSVPASDRWTARAASARPTVTPLPSPVHGAPASTGPRGTYAEPPPTTATAGRARAPGVVADRVEARLPARRLAMGRPRPATGGRGRPRRRPPRRPSRRARRPRAAGRRSRVAPAVAPVARGRLPATAAESVAAALDADAGALGHRERAAAERVEHEVPRPDVADLAAAEARS